jgi:hypothetical protein
MNIVKMNLRDATLRENCVNVPQHDISPDFTHLQYKLVEAIKKDAT